MTTYYVDSAGSNTSPYDTWAKAATSILTIAAIDVAGDTIYVASTHSESSSLISLSFAGTASAPTRVISADKTSGAPPATIAAGALFASTSTLGLSGSVYVYGITFTGTQITFQPSASGASYFESCSFQMTGSNSNQLVVTTGVHVWNNCSVKFSSATQSLGLFRALRWTGGSVLAGGTSPTTLCTSNSTGGPSIIENVDLSNLAASVNLCNFISVLAQITFRNVTLPTNWSGALNAVTRPANQLPTVLTNCDYAATNYAYQRWDNYGDVFHEKTHVMTGGSSDGTTTLAWKLVSQAHAATFPVSRLECAELTFWNKTIGVARTVTLEYLHDSVTGLKNDEFWIEVDYLGSASTPIGSMVSSAKADVLQAGATNPSSAAVWNVTGLSNPNAQYVSVTFTPQMVGAFIVRMCLCKASYTVYVDRKVTVTG